MLTREYVQTCARCSEVTPHSRRFVAWPWIAVGTCAIGAARGLSQGDVVLGIVLSFVGLYLFLRYRERHWSVRCERCRWKQVKAVRRTKPRLDGRTEIFLL